MNGEAVVLALWGSIQERNWPALRGLLHDELVVHWPTSRERITGAENFVAVNAEYPEGWSIDIRSVIASGAHVASEVWVPHDPLGLFAVASFWTVENDKVRRGTEYWTAPGTDARPDWRVPYTDLVPADEPTSAARQ